MHCVSIDFDGLKRLSKTRCNTDTRLLAFVGPNEAGKSSLLQALVWLTQEAQVAMAPRDYTRGRDELGEDEEQVVVGGKYELNPADKAIVADLAVEGEITGFRLERRMGGSQGSDATPIPKTELGILKEAGLRHVRSWPRTSAAPLRPSLRRTSKKGRRPDFRTRQRGWTQSQMRLRTGSRRAGRRA